MIYLLCKNHKYHWACQESVIMEYKNNKPFRQFCQIRLIDELNKNDIPDEKLKQIHEEFNWKKKNKQFYEKFMNKNETRFSMYVLTYHFDILDEWSWNKINDINYRYEYECNHHISHPVIHKKPI